MQKFRLPYRILMRSIIGSKLFQVNISCVLVDDLSFFSFIEFVSRRDVFC